MIRSCAEATRWVILLALATTGCATIAGGSHDQKVAVDSSPEGAAVFVDGKAAGVTPTQVTLKRDVDHEILIEKPGFEPYQTAVKSGLNPWIFGNLAIGGVMGLAIDIGCDSCHRLTPDSVTSELHTGTATTAMPPGITPAAN